MINIVGSVPCAGATVECDEWIPLKVSWNLPRRERPLYVVLDGLGGGYVELKIDPVSGALLQLIVVDRPPECDATGDPDGPQVRTADFAPVIDLSTFPAHDPDVRIPAPIARRAVPMCGRFGPTTSTVMLSRAAPVTFVDCGPVRVGLSARSEMAELFARIAAPG